MSLRYKAEKWEVPEGIEKCARVRHNRVEWDHCRVHELEVLSQALGPLDYLTASIRVIKEEDVGQSRVPPPLRG